MAEIRGEGLLIHIAGDRNSHAAQVSQTMRLKSNHCDGMRHQRRTSLSLRLSMHNGLHILEPISVDGPTGLRALDLPFYDGKRIGHAPIALPSGQIEVAAGWHAIDTDFAEGEGLALSANVRP